MTKVMFVCHGNICRSPMAEFVMKDLAAKAGVRWTDPNGNGPAGGNGAAEPQGPNAAAADLLIASAATSLEEIGCGVYAPARANLRAHGIGTPDNDLGVSRHRAHQITRAEFDDFDLIICMEEYNLRNMQRTLRMSNAELAAARRAGKVSLLLEHAPAGYTRGRLDVDDPWYTGDFESTWRDVSAGCQGLLDELQR